MDKKRRRAVILLFLALSTGNYFRIGGHEAVTPVLFLTIAAMGFFAGVLLSDLAHLARSRKEKEDKDKMI